MGCSNNSWCYFICFFFLAGLATSSSFISNDVLDAHGHSSRNLLQLKKKCTVNFENMNYTIITSRCKGPTYERKSCCDALKYFTCPVVDAINDRESDCAATMFSYINLYGKYPPGLFANQCKENTDGLACDPAEGFVSAAHIAATQSSMLMLTAGLTVFLLGFF
ncbi:hypothetical protein Tsubulata_023637 [Turnera subulata]|uniref:GPI-anchored protein LLG1-like domain-containing protein n=1 Tax=Turnera subulata TaxID=218843 RepID=A0A9Q0JGB6_9ROSI|nr:hypothetical protein Tsubulata_023637 [Turnera subulata]